MQFRSRSIYAGSDLLVCSRKAYEVVEKGDIRAYRRNSVVLCPNEKPPNLPQGTGELRSITFSCCAPLQYASSPRSKTLSFVAGLFGALRIQ